MTPSVIADFMARMFNQPGESTTLLDAGAGIGSLTLAAVPLLGKVDFIDVWEVDPIMLKHLRENLENLDINHQVHSEDFILSAVQNIALATGKRYTHAILNPPYKKLNTDSVHRALLRKVRIETVNLYTAFVALAVLLMKNNGEVVAIIPRSFCNGPYYRPFRSMVLKTCAIDRIHVFESRCKAFKDDDVLQENVIIKFTRGKPQGDVTISWSHDQHLNDYEERSVSFDDVVKPTDPELFIHVPTEQPTSEQGGNLFEKALDEIGLGVSTGPAVDFRLKYFWMDKLQPNAVPIIYPHHFSGGTLQYPKDHKKPNALLDSFEVRRWVMPNECYVLVKRFTSKEERRRIVAYVYQPELIDAKIIAFENHWNVFHCKKHGIDLVLARGLACFLNSTVLDKHFRVFSGHTQVNATDLRNMKYPPLMLLRRLGEKYRTEMPQYEIDELVQTAK